MAILGGRVVLYQFITQAPAVEASTAADEPMTTDSWPGWRRPPRRESPESRPVTSRAMTSSRSLRRRGSARGQVRRPADVSTCCDDFETRFSPVNTAFTLVTHMSQVQWYLYWPCQTRTSVLVMLAASRAASW